MHNRWRNVLFVLAWVLSFSGCGTKEEPTNRQNKERVLRIGVADGCSGYEMFIDAFKFTYPDTKVEVVNVLPYTEQTRDQLDSGEISLCEEMKKKMNSDQSIDLIMVRDEETGLQKHCLYELAKHNFLAPLEPIARKGNVNLKRVVSSVTKDMEKIGEGTLYTLPTKFSAKALYYNKEIFKAAGVDLPKDDMTWAQVFALAERLAKKEGPDTLYGLGFSNSDKWNEDLNDLRFDHVLKEYVSPLGLKAINEESTQMTVNTPQWEEVFTTFLKLAQNKVIKLPGERTLQYLEQDEFKRGKMAMRLAPNPYIHNLIAHNERASTRPELKNIQWGVVCPPSTPSQPNIGGSYNYDYIFAVNKNYKSDAVSDFIGFYFSEKMIKHQAKKNDGGMPIFLEYMPSIGKESTDYTPFYKKEEPVSSVRSALFAPLNKGYRFRQVIYSGESFFNEMMIGKKTPKQALEAWDKLGNELLMKSKQNLNR